MGLNASQWLNPFLFIFFFPFNIYSNATKPRLSGHQKGELKKSQGDAVIRYACELMNGQRDWIYHCENVRKYYEFIVLLSVSLSLSIDSRRAYELKLKFL